MVDTPVRLLREELRADRPRQERAVAGVMAVLCACTYPLAALLYPQNGPRLTWQLVLVITIYVAWFAAVNRAMARGWYHPVVTWLQIAIEVSLPIPFLLLAAVYYGPIAALSNPLVMSWGALIMLSSIRMNPRWCLLAGVLASAAYLAIFLALAGTIATPATVNETLPFRIFGSVLLIFAGVSASIIARHMHLRAEEALHAVRQQDLMGKYLLEEPIAQGGMAEVFRATYSPEGGFAKTVAIKRVLPELSSDPMFMQMFLEEARLGAMLNHPNIVQVLDCGRFRGQFILAMEYVDGISLQTLLRALAAPLPLPAFGYLASELAAGLAYIHQRTGPDGRPLGLVHRDINPPNVLLSNIGEVKLADFGVACALSGRDAQRLFMGKLSYAAPEQLQGKPFDARADLFALGLTLYEALTGRPALFEGAEALLKRGELPPIPRPSDLRPEVPRALDEIILRLLALQPAARTASAGQLRAEVLALELDVHPRGSAMLAECVQRAQPIAHPPPAANQSKTEVTAVLARAPAA